MSDVMWARIRRIGTGRFGGDHRRRSSSDITASAPRRTIAAGTTPAATT